MRFINEVLKCLRSVLFLKSKWTTGIKKHTSLELNSIINRTKSNLTELKKYNFPINKYFDLPIRKSLVKNIYSYPVVAINT